jgi:hypothetical protein
MLASRSLARNAVVAVATIASLALAACSSSSPSSPVPSRTAQVRAIHASPDAGPVDIYVYKGASRPSTPTVAAATFPQITNYLTIPVGTYSVDVIAPAGSPSSTTPVASETVTVASNVQYSIAVGGKVSAKTLQFVNFVEPAETAGVTAVIVHHASPTVQSLINPVGVAIYDAAAAAGGPPAAGATTQLFTFSLTPSSGPAASGSVSGGEFFLSPLPAGLPAAIGFAAGGPGGSSLASVAVYATPSQLASVLTQQTSAQAELAADSSSAFPSGAHLSVFAVDTATSAELIGTLDP